MSSSEWGSLCSPCRNKGKEKIGRENFQAWRDLGMSPQYGPEPCFSCGGDYEKTQWIFSPKSQSMWWKMLGGSGKEQAMADQRYMCSSCWYVDNNLPPAEKVDVQTKCDTCKDEIVLGIPIQEDRQDNGDGNWYDDDEEEERVEYAVYLRRHICTVEVSTIYVEAPEGLDHNDMHDYIDWGQDITWERDEYSDDAGETEIDEVEVIA